MKKGTARTGMGTTLVETVVVLAVLLALFGLLVPVLVSARKASKDAREISDLHQLGIAANLYHDANGRWPLGTPALVSSGLVPKSIVASPNDEAPSGVANALVDRLALSSRVYFGRATEYRRSYVRLYDYGHPYSRFTVIIEPQPGAGWLVSLTRATPHTNRFGVSDPVGERLVSPDGTYLRLLLDGSVAIRSQRRIETQNRTSFSVSSMFADGNEAWHQALFKH